MPTILRVFGYRVSFYQADLTEPPHVHVRKQRGEAKFWMSPIELADSRGFRPHELGEIRKILEENLEFILAKWQEQESIRGDGSGEDSGR